MDPITLQNELLLAGSPPDRAKRRDSRCESGLRTGAWQKMLVKRGQARVIAHYTPSLKTFDAFVIGYYEGAKVLYAAPTRGRRGHGREDDKESRMTFGHVLVGQSAMSSTRIIRLLVLEDNPGYLDRGFLGHRRRAFQSSAVRGR